MSTMQEKTAGLQSVRMVARRTGLTPDVLRAWEKRYGAVKPGRSAGGQRVYDAESVERLLLLSRAVGEGRSISQVATLDTEALRGLVAADSRAAVAHRVHDSSRPAVEAGQAIDAAEEAIERLDAYSLESVLRRAVFRLGADEMIDAVVTPLFTLIGERWHAGELRPSHEHLATAVIRKTLDWMFAQTAPPVTAPSMVVATPSGQVHEMGAMLAAAAAASRGWRVIYLGANLPASDIAAAATQANARAVALSVVHPADDRALPGELRALRAALPRETALLVGGAAASADGYRGALRSARATELASLAALREWLGAQVNA